MRRTGGRVLAALLAAGCGDAGGAGTTTEGTSAATTGDGSSTLAPTTAPGAPGAARARILARRRAARRWPARGRRDGRLYVASLVDFDPAHLGPFLQVDIASQAITQIGATLGKFDGIEPWQGRFLLSDNQVGRLVAIDGEGASEVLFDLQADHGFAPTTDHGVDPDAGVICVPNLTDSVGFVRTQ